MLKTTPALTLAQGKQKKQAQKQAIWSALTALTGWQAKIDVIPRARCHFLRLDTRNIPRRQLAASLRLQLTQLTGQTQTGFAWKTLEGNTWLWYWDETPEGIATPATGHVPWPEPLLRNPPADGIHLLTCAAGFEAVSLAGGQLRRSRWWAKMPTEAAWTNFVRDAGQDTTHFPYANLRATPATTTPPPHGWKISSRHLRPTPLWVWCTALLTTLAGMALIAGSIYDQRIDDKLQEKQAQISRLKQENATTLRLQHQIAAQQTWLETLARAKPGVFQILLLKDIADSGLVGGETGVSLAEWEYRSGRLRLLFVVPEDKFNLSDFLAHLEERPIFKEVKLMPDTPARTVGIQATLAAAPAPEKDGEKLAPAP